MVAQRVSMAVSVVAFLIAGCGRGPGGGSGGNTTTNAAACPDPAPKAGDSCSETIDCVYEQTTGTCPSAEVHASCSDGEWHVLLPAVCKPLPAGALCDPVGTWAVTETGPWDPPEELIESYTGPFEVTLTLGQNGVIYVEAFYAKLSADGCVLVATERLRESCEEYDGEEFCGYVDRHFTLDFSTMPAVGTATVELWGETDAETSAPVEATKQP